MCDNNNKEINLDMMSNFDIYICVERSDQCAVCADESLTLPPPTLSHLFLKSFQL